MIGTDSLALKNKKTKFFLGSEMEFMEGAWQLAKKRTIQVEKRPDVYVSWSLDLNVFSRISSDDREAFNQAEVYLLHEELPIFMKAFIGHPISFPTSYSQKLSMERGMHCLRLASQEPFEDFAERLSGALGVLEKM
ncbi:hypothetical protein [uncultured Planococcus sp.]|uniref:hypothetical protein n=1 Tax=uncultured Planococcus sp. TaxID=337815 RepID=UPI00260329FC|nr:hypothetical protein [uncultured Planococcus sp.]